MYGDILIRCVLDYWPKSSTFLENDPPPQGCSSLGRMDDLSFSSSVQSKSSGWCGPSKLLALAPLVLVEREYWAILLMPNYNFKNVYCFK